MICIFTYIERDNYFDKKANERMKRNWLAPLNLTTQLAIDCIENAFYFIVELDMFVARLNACDNHKHVIDWNIKQKTWPEGGSTRILNCDFNLDNIYNMFRDYFHFVVVVVNKREKQHRVHLTKFAFLFCSQTVRALVLFNRHNNLWYFHCILFSSSSSILFLVHTQSSK